MRNPFKRRPKAQVVNVNVICDTEATAAEINRQFALARADREMRDRIRHAVLMGGLL